MAQGNHRRPELTTAVNQIVIQISRGLAPARCIANAAYTCGKVPHVEYRLIDCKPAAEAKEEAARIALELGVDLVLIEDDMMPAPEIWAQVFQSHRQDTVLYAETPCRNGERNVYRNKRGEFTYSGTVLVKVPLAVLRRLAHRPIFEPWEYMLDEHHEPVPVRKDPHGFSSDVYFWQQVRKLPGVCIVPLGHVDSIASELNSGAQRPNSPSVLTVFQYR